MWEMIEQMTSNRLWIYTALVGSLFGLAFSTYFKGTRIGLWLYAKFDGSVDYLVERFGWTWFCLLYTSPSPRDVEESRMPSSA